MVSNNKKKKKKKKKKKAKYQGILGIALGAATLLGPIIGGALADVDQWR
jgi:MFS family permease